MLVPEPGNKNTPNPPKSHVIFLIFLRQTHLIESLEHPFVPVAEHVQPLHLSLPEHLWRHILSPEDTQGDGRDALESARAFAAKEL